MERRSRSQTEGAFEARMARFPLLELRSPSVAKYDHVNVTSFFACIDLALARRAPFVVLHDGRDMPRVDDDRRRDFMAQLEARRPAIERYALAYAAVVGSPLERGIITAFTWFVSVPFPLRIFTHEAEAAAWLGARYDGALAQARDALSAE